MKIVAVGNDGDLVATDSSFSEFTTIFVGDEPLGNHHGIQLDYTAPRYLVTGGGGINGNESGVYAITSGERTALSTNSLGEGDRFSRLYNFDIDYATGMIYLLEQRYPDREARLFMVDAESGNRRVISASDVPNEVNGLVGAQSITIYQGKGFGLVTTGESDDGYGVYAVDLKTGHRVVFNKTPAFADE